MKPRRLRAPPQYAPTADGSAVPLNRRAKRAAAAAAAAAAADGGVAQAPPAAAGRRDSPPAATGRRDSPPSAAGRRDSRTSAPPSEGVRRTADKPERKPERAPNVPAPAAASRVPFPQATKPPRSTGRVASAAAPSAKPASTAAVAAAPATKYNPLQGLFNQALAAPFAAHDMAELAGAFAAVGRPHADMFAAITAALVDAEARFDEATAAEVTETRRRAAARRATGSAARVDGSAAPPPAPSPLLDARLGTLRDLNARDASRLLTSFLLVANVASAKTVFSAAARAFHREHELFQVRT